MTRRPHHVGRPGRRLTAGRVAVGALVAGAAACLVVGIGAASSTAPPGAAARGDRPVPATAPARTVPVARSVAPRQTRPRRITIPGIDVRTSLVRLGVQPDGTVEVPSDPARAGWFDPGTVPGDVGSAVVLGHVDSVTGPAVFARLSELRRGAVVRVALSDGSEVRFRVQGVHTYPNAGFPAERVYRGRPGRRLLTLVTCGGAYDRARGGYQSNVVVYARAA